MTRVAISQSNYIPWRGYFDLIRQVDFFVLFDNVQFTRRDWRNRNKVINTNGQLIWLTIPVKTKGKFLSPINQIETIDHIWRKNHLNTIQNSYRHTPHFKQMSQFFEELYLEGNDKNLSLINRKFIEKICWFLEIDTQIVTSLAYPDQATATEKLLLECERFNANTYLSGPSASSYLDTTKFNNVGIDVEWMSYDGYPTYDQNTENFENFVSVVDLLFNQGRDSRQFLLNR